MRAWAVLTLLVIAPALLGSASSHHGSPTAGIIRSGPATWDAQIDTEVHQHLEGQVHADGAQDILIGLPNGFPDCPDCHSDWTHVTLVETEPTATYDAIEDHGGHALSLTNTTWPFDQVLRVRFTVTLTIGDDAPAGPLPFELGIRTSSTDCGSDICVGTGAIARVTATVSERPTVQIATPLNNTIVAPSSNIAGHVTGPHTIERLTIRIDDDAPRSITPVTDWTHQFTSDDLKQGTHKVQVSATDSAGRTGHDTVWIRVDTDPPSATLTTPRANTIHIADTATINPSPASITVGPTTIRADANDDIGVAYVRLCVWTQNGHLVHCQDDTQAPYENRNWHTAATSGPHRATVQAYDHVGNRSPVATHEFLHIGTG